MTIVDSPSIEIGGVNYLQFSFCSLWDGYDKTVRFYKNETDCYPVDIVNDVAKIPPELISEGASFYFFIEGIYGEKRRRSQILKLKVESPILIVENADSDIQLRLIEIIENMDKTFSYDDLSDEDKADLRQKISTINEVFTSTYTVTGLTSKIPINIPEYKHGTDILEAYINGMKLIEDVDYANDGAYITLTKPLAMIGQVHIAVTKSIALTSEDWEALQGEEIEAITNIEIDKIMEL